MLLEGGDEQKVIDACNNIGGEELQNIFRNIIIIIELCIGDKRKDFENALGITFFFFFVGFKNTFLTLHDLCTVSVLNLDVIVMQFSHTCYHIFDVTSSSMFEWSLFF